MKEKTPLSLWPKQAARPCRGGSKLKSREEKRGKGENAALEAQGGGGLPGRGVRPPGCTGARHRYLRLHLRKRGREGHGRNGAFPAARARTQRAARTPAPAPRFPRRPGPRLSRCSLAAARTRPTQAPANGDGPRRAFSREAARDARTRKCEGRASAGSQPAVTRLPGRPMASRRGRGQRPAAPEVLGVRGAEPANAGEAAAGPGRGAR